MFNYKDNIVSLANFMAKNGFTKKPFPKFILKTEDQDEELFIMTGYYEPSNKKVVAYIKDRHPKDVLRSIAHELIHHKQNLEGRLKEGAYNGDTIINDKKLEELEKEAYMEGNIGFRKWTEYQKQK